MSLFYAGIGSRETPDFVLKIMERIGAYAAGVGMILRSGGAGGADQAFERGCDSVNPKLKEIWLPWNGFNGNYSDFIVDANPDGQAMKLAAAMHPNWEACKQGARKLHARNGHQILGANFDSPVCLVICWTPGGKSGGGTGQAIRIANSRGIHVLDLYNHTGCQNGETFSESAFLEVQDIIERYSSVYKA